MAAAVTRRGPRPSGDSGRNRAEHGGSPRWAAVLVVGIALTLVAAGSVRAQEVGILDDVVGRFRVSSFSWIDMMVRQGQAMMRAVVLVEFVTACIWWAVKGNELSDAAGKFAVKVLLVGMWYSMMFTYELWIPTIYNSLRLIGMNASGQPTVNPSEILDQGLEVAGAMFAGIYTSGLFINGPLSLVGFLAILLAFLAYVGMATRLMQYLIQGFLSIAVGPFFFGLSGWRSTAGFTEKSVMSVIRNGMRLMVMQLMVTLATLMGGEMAGTLRRAGPLGLTEVLTVMGIAIALLVIVWQVPENFANEHTQGVDLGIASGIRATT